MKKNYVWKIRNNQGEHKYTFQCFSNISLSPMYYLSWQGRINKKEKDSQKSGHKS